MLVLLKQTDEASTLAFRIEEFLSNMTVEIETICSCCNVSDDKHYVLLAQH